MLCIAAIPVAPLIHRLVRDRVVTLVGKRHILEGDLPAHLFGFELERAWFIGNLNRHIQVLKNALKEGQCALYLDLNIEQLSDREKEPALQCRKGYDCTECHTSAKNGKIMNNLPTGD